MIRARLSHFDIAQANLKPEHAAWLRAHALGFLARGGSLRVIGLASPTGDRGFNQALSRRRADAVVSFLRGLEHKSFKVARNDAMGLDAARMAGLHLGNEDGRWRSVILSVWDRPEPPPPPPQAPVPPVQLVERPAFIKVILQEELSSPFMDDADRNAEVVAGLGQTAAQYGGAAQRIIERRTTRQPETHHLQEIRISRSEENQRTGGLLGARVRMVYLDVTYVWGIGAGPIRLIDATSPPTVTRQIARDQAGAWINTPATAYYRRRWS